MTVPIPEAIPYPEGKFRPASMPVNSGYFPYNVYLQAGKVGININKRYTGTAPVESRRTTLGVMDSVIIQ